MTFKGLNGYSKSEWVIPMQLVRLGIVSRNAKFTFFLKSIDEYIVKSIIAKLNIPLLGR